MFPSKPSGGTAPVFSPLRRRIHQADGEANTRTGDHARAHRPSNYSGAVDIMQSSAGYGTAAMLHDSDAAAQDAIGIFSNSATPTAEGKSPSARENTAKSSNPLKAESELAEQDDLTMDWVLRGRKAMLQSLGVEELEGPLAAYDFMKTVAGSKYREKLRGVLQASPGVVYVSPKTLSVSPRYWHAPTKPGQSGAPQPDATTPCFAAKRLPELPSTPATPNVLNPENESSPDRFNLKRFSASTQFIPKEQVTTWSETLLQHPSERQTQAIQLLDDGCLSRVKLFHDCPTDIRHFMLKYATYACMPPGSVIYRQNDPADSVYVILSGFVNVTIDLSVANVADLDPEELREFAHVTEKGVQTTFGPLQTFGETGVNIMFREIMNSWSEKSGRSSSLASPAAKKLSKAFFPDSDSPATPQRSADSTPSQAGFAPGSPSTLKKRARRSSDGSSGLVSPSDAMIRKMEHTVRYSRLMYLLKQTVDHAAIDLLEPHEQVLRSSTDDSDFNPGGWSKSGVSSARTGLASPRTMAAQNGLHRLMQPPDGSPPLHVQGGRRVATVTVAKDAEVHLLRIPAIPFLYLLARNRREVQDIATLVMRQTDLFAAWPKRMVDAIALTAKKRTYHPGDIIARQGDMADGVFILLLGHCRVVRTVQLETPVYDSLTRNLSRQVSLYLQPRLTSQSLMQTSGAEAGKSGDVASAAAETHGKNELSSASMVHDAEASAEKQTRMLIDVMRLRRFDTFGFSDVILGADIENFIRQKDDVMSSRKSKRLKSKTEFDESQILAKIRPERRRSSLFAILEAVKDAEALGLRLQPADACSEGLSELATDPNARNAISSHHTYSQTLVAESRVELVYIPRVPALLDICLSDPGLAQRTWDIAIKQVPSDQGLLQQLTDTVAWTKYKTTVTDNVLREYAWDVEKQYQSGKAPRATDGKHDGQQSSSPRYARLDSYRDTRYEEAVVPESAATGKAEESAFSDYVSKVMTATHSRRALANPYSEENVKKQAELAIEAMKNSTRQFTLLASAPDMALARMRTFLSPQSLGLKLSEKAAKRSSIIAKELSTAPSTSDAAHFASARTLSTISSQELVGRLLTNVSVRKIALPPLPLDEDDNISLEDLFPAARTESSSPQSPKPQPHPPESPAKKQLVHPKHHPVPSISFNKLMSRSHLPATSPMAAGESSRSQPGGKHATNTLPRLPSLRFSPRKQQQIPHQTGRRIGSNRRVEFSQTARAKRAGARFQSLVDKLVIPDAEERGRSSSVASITESVVMAQYSTVPLDAVLKAAPQLDVETQMRMAKRGGFAANDGASSSNKPGNNSSIAAAATPQRAHASKRGSTSQFTVLSEGFTATPRITPRKPHASTTATSIPKTCDDRPQASEQFHLPKVLQQHTAEAQSRPMLSDSLLSGAFHRLELRDFSISSPPKKLPRFTTTLRSPINDPFKLA